MRDTNEEIVDRVLRGLREAAPPESMERRIVSAARRRASAKLAPNHSPWRTATLAGCAVAASVVCALLLIPHSKMRQASVPHPKTASMQTVNGPLVPSRSAKLATRQQAIRKRNPTAALPPKKDLAVVSYPAPPMPLTEQEKLLLRLAHKGDPIQLAMLDPAQREANYADERAQVQQFFTPPKQEPTSEP